MRVLPIVLALSLPGMALAQQTDFKIYPGAVTQFDQTCTSFTSRCALGGPGGEVLQEYPMASLAANGASTDFFRGVGDNGTGGVPVCEIACVFYITQDQNGIDQEAYDLIARPLAGSGSGPDTNNANAMIPPGAITLLTPPNGPPSPVAWGIKVVFGSPVVVPCASSMFVGMTLANNSAWVANGQSLQGSWHQGGGSTAGDPAATDAGDISWQITAAGVAGQCGTRRSWDYGISVNCSTLNMANIHADAICPINPACGIGGLYPSNTARGDGVALCVRDGQQADGAGIYSFMSFGPSPVPFLLTGVLNKSIWIGPSPFIQISFGANTLTGGEARDSAAFLSAGALTGLGGTLWFQSIVWDGQLILPLSFTNAAATELDPVN